MNQYVRAECEGYALAAGAIAPCGRCRACNVSTADDHATAAAYEAVGRAWVRGEFPDTERGDVMRTLAWVLATTKALCSACGARGLDARRPAVCPTTFAAPSITMPETLEQVR